MRFLARRPIFWVFLFVIVVSYILVRDGFDLRSVRAIIFLIGLLFLVSTVNKVNSESSAQIDLQDKPNFEPRLAIRLLKTILPSDQEQQNIIGDLLEEYWLIKSKLRASVWLYKQILISGAAIIWKTIKNNISSMLRKRIR
jgi:hypothetical protein